MIALLDWVLPYSKQEWLNKAAQIKQLLMKFYFYQVSNGMGEPQKHSVDVEVKRKLSINLTSLANWLIQYWLKQNLPIYLWSPCHTKSLNYIGLLRYLGQIVQLGKYFPYRQICSLGTLCLPWTTRHPLPTCTHSVPFGPCLHCIGP